MIVFFSIGFELSVSRHLLDCSGPQSFLQMLVFPRELDQLFVQVLILGIDGSE